MKQSHSDTPSKTLFFDIETTGNQGATPGRDTIIEIAIVDEQRRIVLKALINPERSIGDTKKYTGITDEMLEGKKTLRDLWPTIEAIVTGCHIVMYNADSDIRYFPRNLEAVGHVSCAMKRFAPIYGDYSKYHNDYTFKSLKVATEFIEYKWEGRPHRALPDAQACRAVWQWMEDRDDFNDSPSSINSHSPALAIA